MKQYARLCTLPLRPVIGRGFALALALVATVAAGACEPKVIGESCDLLPGDLVISELMIDPLGTFDTGHEWIEIYNASSQELVLDRLHLVRRDIRADGSVDVRQHNVRQAGALAAGAYFVFGDGAPSMVVDYSYDAAGHSMELGEGGDNLSDLGNITDTYPTSEIAIVCGDVVVDRVTYGEGTPITALAEGKSLSLDGAVPPDAVLNDNGLLWCSGGDTFDALGHIGSPGQANLPCGFVRCEEDGVFRDGVPPEPGDIVISEAMIDAYGSADSQKYWIEVFVTANHPIDLNELTIVTEGGGAEPNIAVVGVGTACLTIPVAGYAVIGASGDLALNGGLSVDAVAPELEFSTPFKDEGGEIRLTRFDRDLGAMLELDRAVLPPRQADESGRSPRECREGEEGTPYTTLESCESRIDPDTGQFDPNRPTACTWNDAESVCEGGAKKYSGRSLMLDGPALAFPEALDLNDRAAAFCYAPDDADLLFEGIGTPGAPNGPCGTVACVDGLGAARPVRIPAVGDLVLTEIYPDPLDADRSKEWVELTATADVDLNGVQLVTAKVSTLDPEGSPRDTNGSSLGCVEVVSGERVILSVLRDEDLGLGVDLGGIVPRHTVLTPLDGFFLNVDSTEVDLPRLRVELLWGTEPLDVAEVNGPIEGVTVQVRPERVGVATNEAPEDWCSTNVAVFFEGAGTPGVANVCGPACFEGPVLRPAVLPGPGDLIVTEIFPDPAGTERSKEWVELYVAGAAVDLNAIALAAANVSVATPSWRQTGPGGVACVSAASGTYPVVAIVHEDDLGLAVDHGGITPSYELSTTLTTGFFLNVVDTEILRVELSSDGVLIDAAEVLGPPEGASASLRPQSLDAALNDLPGEWCVSEAAGLFTGLGTPGRANLCGPVCLDGVDLRAVVWPAVGELVLTEVMSDPSGADDDRDWLEVVSRALGPVDLNGLVVRSTSGTGSVRDWPLLAPSCVALGAGEIAVFGGVNAVQDGVTVDVVISGLSTSLLFATSPMFLELRAGPTVLDASPPFFATAQVPPDPPAPDLISSTASTNLDPDALLSVDPALANDDVASWCLAQTSLGGFIANGSPGLPNEECP